jgi:hypothetical protein
LGKQDRLREREKHAYSNGFVSGVVLNAVLLAQAEEVVRETRTMPG